MNTPSTPLTQPDASAPEILGYSHENRPILLYQFGHGPKKLLLLGGVHGNEVEGFHCSEKLLELISRGHAAVPAEVTLYLCPRLNPDGCASLRRTNHRNVDLNRNMPTQNWTASFTHVPYYPGSTPGSEPETQALMKTIEKLSPQAIVSLHSYEKAMVNFDGAQSEALAVAMSKKNNLPPKGDIGYPTPGSLGNYAAHERKIPTVTLEILRGQKLDDVWAQHYEGLLESLQWLAKN